MIKLYNEKTQQQKYYLIYRDEDANEMLAVALTAAANNQSVNAYFDNSLSRPLLYNLFLYNREFKK